MVLSGFEEVSEILRAGVYALAHRGSVVYVGKAKRMLVRVYTHQNLYGTKGKKPSWLPTKGILFDQVFVRPCRIEDLDELEREMIELYKPRFNTMLKTPSKVVAEVPLVINGHSIVLNGERQQMSRRC